MTLQPERNVQGLFQLSRLIIVVTKQPIQQGFFHSEWSHSSLHAHHHSFDVARKFDHRGICRAVYMHKRVVPKLGTNLKEFEKDLGKIDRE